jgi:hypothetical protein
MFSNFGKTDGVAGRAFEFGIAVDLKFILELKKEMFRDWFKSGIDDFVKLIVG